MSIDLENLRGRVVELEKLMKVNGEGFTQDCEPRRLWREREKTCSDIIAVLDAPTDPDLRKITISLEEAGRLSSASTEDALLGSVIAKVMGALRIELQ